MDNKSERSKFFRNLSIRSKTGSVSTKMSDNDTIKAVHANAANTTSSSGDSSGKDRTASSGRASIVVTSAGKTSHEVRDSDWSPPKPGSSADSKDDFQSVSNSSSSHSNPLYTQGSKSSSKASKIPSASSSIYGNSLRMAAPDNRASIISDYSGIVQHVDIDTIKYVGNKESLQLSNPSGLSSPSDEMLVVHPTDISRNNSIVSMGSTNLPIPAFSPRRSVNNENIAKVLRNHQDKSPVKCSGATPPSSPLPKINKYSLENISPAASPLKSSTKRRSVSSGTSGSSVHEQLDEIMKEAEVLKSGSSEGNKYQYSSTFSGIPTTFKKGGKTGIGTLSLTSTTNSLQTGTSSFHTANNSISSPELDEFHDFDDPEYKVKAVEAAKAVIATGEPDDYEPTENLNLRLVTPPRHSRETLDPSRVQSPKFDLKEQDLPQGSSKDAEESKKVNQRDEGPHKRHSGSKSHTKSSPSMSKKTKGSASHKSKRKSSSSTKNKIKPFSYETLAKLLNATDGIILGQEFATLNIPTEEKFLIERIVDSISRLTANMMLNPARYDQSCARLERVLNVLEGFD